MSANPAREEKWQLLLAAPFAVVAIACDEAALFAASYLPKKTRALPPQNLLAAEAAKQLRAYFKNPRRNPLDLPLCRAQTPHQQKVRETLADVAPGETVTYRDVARKIRSSPRAVGGACRANAIPLFVPCHRVVAANSIGGFGGGKQDMPQIKQWLLTHEGATWPGM